MKSESHEYLSLNVPSIPHSTLLLRHHSNRKKAEEILGLNATLGAPKDFLLTLEKNPKCSSRILLVSNVPEKNDFLSSSFSLFLFCVFFSFLAARRASWHEIIIFPWNRTRKPERAAMSGIAQDIWLMTVFMLFCCRSLLNRVCLWKKIVFFRFIHVCLYVVWWKLQSFSLVSQWQKKNQIPQKSAEEFVKEKQIKRIS